MYPWRKAKVVRATQGASDMRSIIVRPEFISPHKAGQHYELCLPGQNIIRKYSIISPTDKNDEIEFGVQLIENGTLSKDLWKLKEGDEVELRGPIGEAFVLDPLHSGPLVLIAAGSGITPLLSMYYSYKKVNLNGKMAFIVTAKDPSRILHYDKIRDWIVTRFTAEGPRIDRAFLEQEIGDMAGDEKALCYVCGSGSFTDDIVSLLRELGFDKNQIFADRFI